MSLFLPPPIFVFLYQHPTVHLPLFPLSNKVWILCHSFTTYTHSFNPRGITLISLAFAQDHSSRKQPDETTLIQRIIQEITLFTNIQTNVKMYATIKTLSVIALAGSVLAVPVADSQVQRRGNWGEWKWGGRGGQQGNAAPASEAAYTNWAATATVYVTEDQPAPTPAAEAWSSPAPAPAATTTAAAAGGQFYNKPSAQAWFIIRTRCLCCPSCTRCRWFRYRLMGRCCLQVARSHGSQRSL